MARPDEPTSRRTWLTLLAVAGLTCGLFGAGLLWAASTVSDFFTEAGWAPERVPRAELTRVFGVRLPAEPLRYTSRQQGFQDPYLEALVLLAPGDEARFLALNGLSQAAEPPGVDLGEAEDELQALVGDAGALEVVALDGVPNLLGGDGGFVALYRQAVLLRGTGGTWVYLVAFGT